MGSKCQCVIGLYYKNGGGELVTLQDLKMHINDVREFNADCCRLYRRDFLSRKEYTLQDYADKRKSTNLTRFDFCPMCGKKINWKKIGRDDG